MSRLTFNPCDECVYSYSKNNQEMTTCKYCEFKTYLDLEKQGRLIELPCAVGDMVWSLDLNIRWIDHFRVTDVTVTEHGIGFENPYLGYGFNVEDLGKTVFSTKEEAEAKLAEMEGAE